MKRPRIGNYAFLRSTLLAVFLSLMCFSSASNATLSPNFPMMSPDPYTQHLRIMSKFYRRFNPNMTVKEIESLCWSIWRGCGGDQQAALWLTMVQALERNFKPEADINCRVQGYSGQYWYVLIKAAREHGMKRPREGWRPYFLAHPFEAEVHIARWFKENFYDSRGAWETLAVWHRGSNWRDRPTDVKDVEKYRHHILLVYKRFYLPIAKEVYDDPPQLVLVKEVIESPPMRGQRVASSNGLDFGVRMD